jgi:16S rRNA processing protein RimM
MRQSRGIVGVFGAAHGVRGEIRVKSFTADPSALSGYGPLSDAAGVRTFTITSARPLKDDLLVVRVAGVADRTTAEGLNGIELFVPRDRLPPAGEEEFYHADLVGLVAELPDRSVLGRVVAVPNFGAGDLLEIAPEAGGETILLPFTKAFVPTVDIPARRLVVILPLESQDEADPGQPG